MEVYLGKSVEIHIQILCPVVQPVILSRKNKAKCSMSNYRQLFIYIGEKRLFILVLCVSINYQFCLFSKVLLSLCQMHQIKSTVQASVLCCQLFAYTMSVFLYFVSFGQSEIHRHTRNLTVRQWVRACVLCAGTNFPQILWCSWNNWGPREMFYSCFYSCSIPAHLKWN